MQQLLIFCICLALVYGETSFDNFEEGGHPRATSHQNIHIVHYHPVPTFIKKEFTHLLKHPISTGQSSSSLEVDHGGQHDQGYAFGDTKLSRNEGFDHGSFGENESGFDENHGDGDFQHEDTNSQDGDDGYSNRGDEGHYTDEGFQHSEGYQSDDGESEESHGDEQKDY